MTVVNSEYEIVTFILLEIMFTNISGKSVSTRHNLADLFVMFCLYISIITLFSPTLCIFCSERKYIYLHYFHCFFLSSFTRTFVFELSSRYALVGFHKTYLNDTIRKRNSIEHLRIN